MDILFFNKSKASTTQNVYNLTRSIAFFESKSESIPHYLPWGGENITVLDKRFTAAFCGESLI